MKIYFTGQNTFGNRGCEALVRSTVAMLRDVDPDTTFLVPSNNIELDQRQWPEAASLGVEFVLPPPFPRHFALWNSLVTRAPFLAALPWPRYDRSLPFLRHIDEADVVLSIGGDNYSLDYDLGSVAMFKSIAEYALSGGKQVILWGASVGPFTAMPAVEQQILRHLKSLSRVTVRETQTEQYLRNLGLTNLTLVADSAFLLAPQSCTTSDFLPDDSKPVLGFNVSPLIEAVRKNSGATTDLIAECVSFIREAIDTRHVHILLVPHVAPLDPSSRVHNNDETFLQRLHEGVGQPGQCTITPTGLNAAQLKHIISRCDYFIGARTHATIAALSSGVPTVSIAYSVKARGINRDLFGDEQLVLDTREVSSWTLMSSLDLLIADQRHIRATLSEKIPTWKLRARSTANSIRRSDPTTPKVA